MQQRTGVCGQGLAQASYLLLAQRNPLAVIVPLHRPMVKIAISRNFDVSITRFLHALA